MAAAADKCRPVAGLSKANENRLTSILKQLPGGELRTFWSSLIPLPMAVFASCHQMALASWMSDMGLIFNPLEEKKQTGRKSTLFLLFPSLTAFHYFVRPQDMWWLEYCKVIGRIKSCGAETQVNGLLALPRGGGGGEMLKFIGWGKK